MKKKKTILDVIYENYNKATNMTYKELKTWKNNPLSKKASLNRKPINMAIKLKAKPKWKWTMSDIKWALRKAIPYLKRAKKIKSKKNGKNTYTRNQIALKNWGYDIKKKKK